ncbi:MAG: Gfo/Idh/MocA family oxidoreductase [Dysgonamonadaceae bacterium]|jgi:predicted dehydrogenase|nr:Gfo/Idh/MocA family oxidoreductase [Dysgonamonadaceae bacterium]
MKHLFFLIYFCLSFVCINAQTPVRIGIDGLSHDHINGLLRNIDKRTDIQLVGIAESNKELIERLHKQFGFDKSIVYDNLEEMIEKVHPQGVVAFNSIFDHLHTVEVCAPKGVHVMVEKPLAVSPRHAEKMAKLARENKIFLLTNYETSWYPTHYKAYELAVSQEKIGHINKVLVNDGHKGPVEIGCSKEFLAWLTDPVLNGGGAVIDFGCYGANLMTWLMRNEKPVSVTAVLQTIKPAVYPKVDDQATIILKYPDVQAVLQGSWNWPVDRKDMEIYGQDGYVKALNSSDLEFRANRNVPVEREKVTDFPFFTRDAFTYFAAIIRGKIELKPTDLASLENNLIVVEILDAAKRSAKAGKEIKLK